MFEEHIQLLVGERVEDVGWSPNVGSAFSLYLGERFKFKDPSPRLLKHRTETDRLYGYSYRLHFWECSWRIQTEDEVILIWSDHHWMDSIVVRSSLKRLEGEFIRNIQVASPAKDLQISFSNGLNLVVFCDCFREPGDEISYDFSFFISNFNYFVGPDGRVDGDVEDALDLSSPLAPEG